MLFSRISGVADSEVFRVFLTSNSLSWFSPSFYLNMLYVFVIAVSFWTSMHKPGHPVIAIYILHHCTPMAFDVKSVLNTRMVAVKTFWVQLECHSYSPYNSKHNQKNVKIDQLVAVKEFWNIRKTSGQLSFNWL